MGERLPLRCATDSLARNEPLIGTASRVQRWLVVEQPGAWGRDALTDSHLPAEVAAPLVAHAKSHRVRVILARRPGDMRPDGDRQVFLAHTGSERRWIEQLVVPAAHPERLLDLQLGPLAFPDPPGVGEPGPAGLALVCTNGRHDPCCADKGRPVVRALHAAGDPDVWEASHVGGDRFAANVVSLPDGVYYGRVEPDEARALLAAHRAGTIDLAHYRGRSQTHIPVEAAAKPAVFFSGQVDWVPGFRPGFDEPLILRAKKEGKKLTFIRWEDYGWKVYGNGLVTHSDLLKRDPKTVANFVGATMDGYAYAIQHPDEALDITLKANPELDRESARLSLLFAIDAIMTKASKEKGLGYMEDDRMDFQIKLMSDLMKFPPPKDAYTNQFIDKKPFTVPPALAAELTKLP